MSNEDLPGFTEATALGYELQSYSANRSKAHYVKDGLTLTVEHHGNGMVASLWSMVGIVEVTIQGFAFPHPLIHKFENQMFSMMTAARKVSMGSWGTQPL